MRLDPVVNHGKVTVSTGYDSVATSLALTAGHGARLPNPTISGAFNLVWWNATDYPDPSDDPNKEIVRCTARSSDTLTVTRGQEGSTAVAHNTGGKTYKMILPVTQKFVNDLQSAFDRIKWGNTWVVPEGTFVAFSTPYFPDTNYGFLPFDTSAAQTSTLSLGTKTVSGVWLYTALDSGLISWIAIGH